ncbi:MAG: TIGR00730 family Rossman fold protein [Lachnospiraceae bacterium]|nr:TIGR00730 family Rossman fold protein [Lachnospiraceae bacterium]
MKIAVYLGSFEGHDPLYKDTVKKLGEWIGNNDHTLVYGGSSIGLMGEVARAALSKGGRVIGVEPSFFIEEYDQEPGVELIPTEDIAIRRTKMIELSDAFIAFPGGIGTLDEISEIIALINLDLLDSPCIIFNLNGYYDHLKLLFEKMTSEGFLPQKCLDKICFAESIEDIENFL